MGKQQPVFDAKLVSPIQLGQQPTRLWAGESGNARLAFRRATVQQGPEQTRRRTRAVNDGRQGCRVQPGFRPLAEQIRRPFDRQLMAPVRERNAG